MPSFSFEESLAESYLDVLQADSLQDVFGDGCRLSGLFLSSLPSDFGHARYRVMIVGMEPKKWRDGKCPFWCREAPTLKAVREAMTVHREFLAERPGPHRFCSSLIRPNASLNLASTERRLPLCGLISFA